MDLQRTKKVMVVVVAIILILGLLAFYLAGLSVLI